MGILKRGNYLRFQGISSIIQNRLGANRYCGVQHGLGAVTRGDSTNNPLQRYLFNFTGNARIIQAGGVLYDVICDRVDNGARTGLKDGGKDLVLRFTC